MPKANPQGPLTPLRAESCARGLPRVTSLRLCSGADTGRPPPFLLSPRGVGQGPGPRAGQPGTTWPHIHLLSDGGPRTRVFGGAGALGTAAVRTLPATQALPEPTYSWTSKRASHCFVMPQSSLLASETHCCCPYSWAPGAGRQEPRPPSTAASSPRCSLPARSPGRC